MDLVALSKKRKLQTEQFDVLPLPKHPCHDHGDSTMKSDEPPDNFSNENHEHNTEQCSETASVKDSNSFVMAGDSECSDHDSMQCTGHIIKDGSSDSSVGDEMFRRHLEFVCSEYGDRNVEEYMEKDIDDVLYSDHDVRQQNATFVLSSGRWNVNQDSSQQVTRKPTIDQEFEQYFSMLML